jgi:hypothetical protein
MPSRERRREDRRKRKARSAERRAEIAERYEVRNREAREQLEPLGADERPTVVTVAAAITTLITALSVAGWALWDVLRDDPRPNAGGVIIFVAIIGAMSYGLWRARYWAVLGFQATLVIVILAATLGTISALTVGLAIGNFVVLAIAGTLFWHMVKALARIQMPERR